MTNGSKKKSKGKLKKNTLRKTKIKITAYQNLRDVAKVVLEAGLQ